MESVKLLRSDLKKQNEVALKLQIDTKVKVSIGKLSSKKVGIRVTGQGIKGLYQKVSDRRWLPFPTPSARLIFGSGSGNRPFN
ncbi:hypothetical protein ACFX15_020859 [Malus domestica]